VDDARLRKLAAAGGVIQINSYGEYLIPMPANPERGKALADLNAKYGRVADLSPGKVAELAQARRAIDAQYAVPQATFEDFMRHLLHALKIVGPDHVGIGPDWDGGGGVAGMNDIVALPKITARLLEAGYSRQDLEKIWSGNLLRVLREAEKYREAQGR
jgi:membrane dipeptidase